MNAVKQFFFKRFFKVGTIVCLAFTAQLAHSQSFDEGKHYTVIEQQQSLSEQQKNEVVEYFSFSCPGCFTLEPSISALTNQQPSLNFRRVHMPFGGRKAKFSQKAFVLMELLKAQKHKDAIFKRLHVKRDLFDSDDEIITFFESLGYEPKLLKQTLESFTADTMTRTMNKEAMKMQIKSVPTVIVNGKYMVNIRSLSSTNQLPALVSYLNSLGG